MERNGKRENHKGDLGVAGAVAREARKAIGRGSCIGRKKS